MRLRNRLERLEDLMMGSPEDGDRQKMKEYLVSWFDHDPQAIPLFKASEDYCRKSGHPYNPIDKWGELRRIDPVAKELERKYLESFLSYVSIQLGVNTSDIERSLKEN